jgi:puromycin-sensitive aminopeptidase
VKKFVENQDGSKATWHFETTPIMSTYLVAYVIGDYDYVEKISDEGTLVRIYTPVGMSHLGQFSLEVIISLYIKP